MGRISTRLDVAEAPSPVAVEPPKPSRKPAAKEADK